MSVALPWPPEAGFGRLQLVRLRNPEAVGADTPLIGESLLGTAGIVTDACLLDGEVVYSVHQISDGSPWALRAAYLESDGDFSTTDPDAALLDAGPADDAEEDAPVITVDEVAWLAGLSGLDPAEVQASITDEHTRYDLYRRALRADAPEAEERILGIVLRDPDRGMAESALVDHVDRLAAGLDGSRPFAERVGPVREAAAGFGFLQRRISEWELLKQSAEHPGECAPEILHASHWLQRKLAAESPSAAVLQALAEDGRTRKIRNIARDRGRRPGPSGGGAGSARRTAAGSR
ncbi:hypothetical protein [Kitasatospora sp. NPDC057223]|uniref:hypothetical protein n=1 Tax=Kitasatospora sp. NPDC057223 TaxID=3346055 RepID=UPI00364170D4